MFKPVIAGYARSPFTMARKGALIDVKPVNLLAEVIKNLVAKSKINKDVEYTFSISIINFSYHAHAYMNSCHRCHSTKLN